MMQEARRWQACVNHDLGTLDLGCTQEYYEIKSEKIRKAPLGGEKVRVQNFAYGVILTRVGSLSSYSEGGGNQVQTDLSVRVLTLTSQFQLTCLKLEKIFLSITSRFGDYYTS